MSEKFPPRNDNNESGTPDHSHDNSEYAGWKARYDKFAEKVANGTATERDKRLMEEFRAKMETHDDQIKRGVTENPKPTPDSHTATSNQNESDPIYDYDEATQAEGSEFGPQTPNERKYEIMRSQEAQDAFMRGGEDEYIKYIEDTFSRINNEYGIPTPGKELQTQRITGSNEAERDAFGNPVHHELEWSRSGEQTTSASTEEQTALPSPDGKSKEIVPVTTPEFSLPEELANAVKEARDKYAELTARDRKSYFVGRYTKDPRSITGKLLFAIPGVRKLTGTVVDKINSHQENEIDNARLEYERLVSEVQALYVQYSVEQNTSPNEIQIGRALIAGNEDVQFEGRVVFHRHDQSKETNKFTNWWVSQTGFTGNLKKAGVVVAGGVTIGAASALAGPWIAALAGSAGGAAFGGFIANHITRRRANAKVTSKNANGEKIESTTTIAEQQSAEDIDAKKQVINTYTEQVASGERQDAFRYNELTDVTEDRSDEEAFNNRSRLRKAVMLGKLAGGLTGLGVGSLVHDTPHIDIPESNNPTPPFENPPEPPTPEVSLNGENFTVEYGSGYTNELMQFADMNGHKLSPEQAYELHQHLMNKFGADYINIQGGGSDIYTQSGDVRLSSPGQASWVEGVTKEAQSWMTGRGLW